MAASDGGAPPASVELRVSSIRRSDMLNLQQLLGTYCAAWRLNQARDTHCAADPLLSGRLQLDVTRLFDDGVVVWQDTLAPVAGCSGQHAAQADPSEAPHYERATGELLAPAHKDSSLLLPGGLAAAKRRAQAEASAVGWVGGPGAAAPDAGGLEAAAHGGVASAVTPMRQRVPLGRCFNCGSYEHDNISKCPLPICMERVSAARAERTAELSAAGASGFRLKQRYFEERGGGGGGCSGSGSSDLAPKPGSLSQQLADALGMPSTSAPPPWLCRMVALGVPAAYLPEAQEQPEHEQQQPEQLTWHDGDSEEGYEGGGEAAAASGDGHVLLDGDGGQRAAVEAAVNGAAAAAHQLPAPVAQLPALPGYLAAVVSGEPPAGTNDVLPWQMELARGRLLAQQVAAAP